MTALDRDLTVPLDGLPVAVPADGAPLPPAVPPTGAVPRSPLARLSPSHRDGLALVLSSGLTSAVGLLYWVVAARLFPPAVLGVNQVAISTMMLLGGVAQLNMTYALLRFVPVAGRMARRLVLGGYVVGAGVAAVVGAVFALGASLWAPELVAAFGRTQLLLFFVVATPLWAVFVIQDFVLTGIRRAAVVPGENLVFSVLKIGLLVVAAVVVVPGGLAISWVVATAVLVLVVNAWLLLRAVPRFGRATAERAVPITLGAVTRFVRADYAGAVFWQAALFGVPLLVLARLGAGDAAVYAIVWTIAQALYVVASGMGQSMVAHSVGDPGGLDAAQRAMRQRAWVIVVPVVVVLVLGAPLVLSVFGGHYADYGAGCLVLAALSAVPNVITSATVAAARVRQRMSVLFGVPATVSVIVIAMSWVLMPYLGITAVGLAWLVAQLLVAGGILLATAPWLPVLGTRIAAVRSAALLRRVRPFAADQPGRRGWVLGERLTGGSDSVVVRYEPPGPVQDGDGALLKATDSGKGRIQLERQIEVLARMHADERLGAWRGLIPTVLGAGDVGGSYAVIESRLPGVGGSRALLDPVRRRTFRSSAVATISELHRCSAVPVVVGDAELQRWVFEPMSWVADALPRGSRGHARELADALALRLRGAVVSSGWTHADYTADNVLVDDEGRALAVVDWCHAQESGLSVLDLVCFLLTSETAVHGTEMGAQVLDRLADPRSGDHELLARAQRLLGGTVLDVGLLSVLGWLQHVSNNIQKSPTFGGNPVWVRRNLVTVVRGAPALLARPPIG